MKIISIGKELDYCEPEKALLVLAFKHIGIGKNISVLFYLPWMIHGRYNGFMCQDFRFGWRRPRIYFSIGFLFKDGFISRPHPKGIIMNLPSLCLHWFAWLEPF